MNKEHRIPNSVAVNEEDLYPELDVNEKIIKGIFFNCSDVVYRHIQTHDKTTILIVYIDGMVDTKSLESNLMLPLLNRNSPLGRDVKRLTHLVEREMVAVASVKKVTTFSTLTDGVLNSNIAMIVEGENTALLANLKEIESRSVEEPTTEVTVRGPKDAFTESLRVNTTLLRRRIKSSQLKMESINVGKYTKTELVIAYIKGIANEELLQEVRTRINKIEVDGVLGSEILEEFIEDVPYSPFPQVQNTERPDIVTANLLEGRIAILVDNTPFNLVIPMTFWSGLQAVEDYYERFIYTSFIRCIRFILLLISLFLPSLYVALTTFHPELIPTPLLISIAGAREGVPFPAIIEALLMEFIFEGLREAGIRLPKAVGSAVSIVGALVIGQAAVEAGIVSPLMVIVVATTGIASFAIPRYNLGIAIRMLRFAILILASIFGLFGIVIGFIILTVHLINLRSFGVPYFTPLAPQVPKDLKDFILRAPRWALERRPAFITGDNKKRVPKGQKPNHPKEKQSEE